KKKILSLKDIGALGIADIGGKAVSSIFWFYIITLMSVRDYGIINFNFGVASFAQTIALIGSTNALTVYVSKNVKIQSTFFVISLICGSVSAFAIFFIFQRVDTAFLLIMLIIGESTSGILLGKKEFRKYSIYNIIQKVLLVAIGIGFFYAFGVNGIIYGIACSYLVFIPMFYVYFRETKIDFSLLKTNKEFIVSSYFLMLVSGVRRDIDKLIVPLLLGFTALGNYALALQVYAVLMTMSMTFYKYTLPHDASGNENRKIKQMMILATVVISGGVFLLAPIIIPHAFPKFTKSIEMIQIISLSIIPATINLMHFSRFMGLEKTRIVITTILLQVATLIIGFIILGTFFNVLGIAMSFLLSAIVSSACSSYFDRILRKTEAQ
ncbi:MAG: hypothetical protein EB158_08795, partial [Nitrosopumilaceae archaeon]|nr:hypothetical protein [Nitrosopumilaceae archaeon]